MAYFRQKNLADACRVSWWRSPPRASERATPARRSWDVRRRFPATPIGSVAQRCSCRYPSALTRERRFGRCWRSRRGRVWLPCIVGVRLSSGLPPSLARVRNRERRNQASAEVVDDRQLSACSRSLVRIVDRIFDGRSDDHRQLAAAAACVDRAADRPDRCPARRASLLRADPRWCSTQPSAVVKASWQTNKSITGYQRAKPLPRGEL